MPEEECSLEGFSEEALESELKRRRKLRAIERYNTELARRIEVFEFIRKHGDKLLPFVKHNKHFSCTDSEPTTSTFDHGRPMCTRCVLLQIMEHRFVEVELDVHLELFIQEDLLTNPESE